MRRSSDTNINLSRPGTTEERKISDSSSSNRPMNMNDISIDTNNITLDQRQLSLNEIIQAFNQVPSF